MRLLKTMPELEKKIETGDLSLCVAAKTQTFFRQLDQRRREDGTPALTLADKREIAEEMVGLSTRECERRLAVISPEAALPGEKTRPLAEGRTLIQFVAGDALLQKLEELKGLLAHQAFDGTYEQLIEILADQALEKLNRSAKLESSKQASQSLPALEVVSQAATSRYIPAAIRRAVWKRDRGRCTYTDSRSGRTCGSRFSLEFDHILPYALGGPSNESNLRLRCRSHNQFTAQQQGLCQPQEGNASR